MRVPLDGGGKKEETWPHVPVLLSHFPLNCRCFGRLDRVAGGDQARLFGVNDVDQRLVIRPMEMSRRRMILRWVSRTTKTQIQVRTCLINGVLG